MDLRKNCVFTILLTILLSASGAWGATYYMRADGTAANAAAATGPCATAASCMSVTTHNASTFATGDTITVCDDGGEYTGDKWVTIPSSGSNSGSRITYIGSGTPVIDTSKITATGDWANSSGTYNVNISTAYTLNYCNIVYEDDVPLPRGDDDITLTNGQWFYDYAARTLYYKPTAGTIADHKVTFSAVNTYRIARAGFNPGMRADGKSNLTIDGITFRNNAAGVLIITDAAVSDNVTIQNCTFTGNVMSDRVLLSNYSASNHTRTGNYYSRSAMGICNYDETSSIYLDFTDNVYTNNEFVDIGTVDGTNIWYGSTGIALADLENIGLQRHSNTTVSGNYIHGGKAYGIFFYGQANAVNLYNSTGNAIHKNKIENIQKACLYVGGDSTFWGWSGNSFYGNICNNTGTLTGDAFVLKLYQEAQANTANYLYGNTIIGGGTGIYMPSNVSQYWTVKNNILSNQSTWYWYVSTNKTELAATNNGYNADGGKWYYNGTAYANFVAWVAGGLDAYGSFASAPLLDSDLRPAANSPVIDHGNATICTQYPTDYAGLNQLRYGRGCEIGAYAFPAAGMGGM